MIRYKDLDEKNQKIVIGLFKTLKSQEPRNWLTVIDGLRDLAVSEVISTVPYRGPSPLPLSPSNR